MVEFQSQKMHVHITRTGSTSQRMMLMLRMRTLYTVERSGLTVSTLTSLGTESSIRYMYDTDA